MNNVCNHDCFHCPYPDCKCSKGPFPEEADIVDAIYRQDKEIKRKRVELMTRRGLLVREIAAILGISRKEINTLRNYNYNQKMPLPDGNRKTAQMKFTYPNNNLKVRICQHGIRHSIHCWCENSGNA